jgi:hypothetical protein
LRQLHGVIVGPEMHEKKMGLVKEHMIVHRLDFDVMRPQSAKHRINFAGQQDEIA